MICPLLFCMYMATPVHKGRYTIEEGEEKHAKEEYKRLIRTAAEEGNTRMALLIETIGSTGIRISELPYVMALGQ